MQEAPPQEAEPEPFATRLEEDGVAAEAAPPSDDLEADAPQAPYEITVADATPPPAPEPAAHEAAYEPPADEAITDPPAYDEPVAYDEPATHDEPAAYDEPATHDEPVTYGEPSEIDERSSAPQGDPTQNGGTPGLTPPSRRGGSGRFITDHIVELGFAIGRANRRGDRGGPAHRRSAGTGAAHLGGDQLRPARQSDGRALWARPHRPVAVRRRSRRGEPDPEPRGKALRGGTGRVRRSGHRLWSR